MDVFFIHFSLPASILLLLLLFQFTSSWSSCHIFNKAFCSLLHKENIRLCPSSASKIDSSDSALPSFFRGMNATYRSELIERRCNGTRVVRVWDPFSGLILRPLSYDFLYKFENPVTDIYPLRLLQENQSVIDFSDIRCLYPRWCNSTQHDPFSKLFDLPPLVKYDIYYSLLSADGLPSNRSDSSSCLEKRQDEDAVAWDLLLFPTTDNSSMGNCYNLSLFAFGFMHGRKLDTQCLSCHILANVNSTFSSRKPADCTCRTSCSGNSSDIHK